MTLVRIVPRHEQSWSSQEGTPSSSMMINNNNAIVPRGDYIAAVLPDVIVERAPQEESRSSCVRTKKFRLGFLLCFAVLALVGIIVGAVVGTIRKGGVSSTSGNNSGLDGKQGTITTPSNQNPDNEMFDIGGPCFIGGILLDCANGLPMTIPDCVVDSYNEYRMNWIPIHDPAFEDEDYEIDSCAPANLGLIVASTTTQQGGFQNDDVTTALQKYVLTTFFMSLNGLEWPNHNNWLSSLPLDQWSGIEVDDDGDIAGIMLRWNLLDGTLPSQLSLLSSTMNYLRLEGNDIVGTIPWQYGTTIKTLSLQTNRLTGTIPTEWGDSNNNIALKDLILYDNFLTGPVPYLPHLEAMELNRNFLTGSITVGTNLRSLVLGQNQFDGTLQEDLGASLVTLGLADIAWDDNRLSLENLFRRSTDLRTLSLGNSRLTGINIPTEIGNCRNLGWFDMSRNQLTGPLPTELGLLTKLSVLRLETNALNGTLPTELGSMDASLETLIMGRNQLTGSLPTELGLLTNLLDLYLEGNALSGIIPSELGRVDELIVLDLWRNHLTGALPSELGRLKNLTFFTFERNELSGVIPNEVCSLWDTGGSLQILGGNDCYDSSNICGSDCYGGASCPSQECCRNCPGVETVSPLQPPS